MTVSTVDDGGAGVKTAPHPVGPGQWNFLAPLPFTSTSLESILYGIYGVYIQSIHVYKLRCGANFVYSVDHTSRTTCISNYAAMLQMDLLRWCPLSPGQNPILSGAGLSIAKNLVQVSDGYVNSGT